MKSRKGGTKFLARGVEGSDNIDRPGEDAASRFCRNRRARLPSPGRRLSASRKTPGLRHFLSRPLLCKCNPCRRPNSYSTSLLRDFRNNVGHGRPGPRKRLLSDALGRRRLGRGLAALAVVSSSWYVKGLSRAARRPVAAQNATSAAELFQLEILGTLNNG
jgi:hypothetical protein